MKVLYRWGLGSLFAILFALLSSSGAYAEEHILVANSGSGTVGEYTTSGATINASLISGLNGPVGIAVSGSNLFVTTIGNGTGSGTVGEYTTSGATINASLISGLSLAGGIAIIPSTVPEPATLTLLGLGLIGLMGLRKRSE